MMKISNKSIISSFGILAILVLGTITIPFEAKADRAGYVTPYNSTRMRSVSSNDGEYNSYVGPKSTYSGSDSSSNNTSSSGVPTVYSSSYAPASTSQTNTSATNTGTTVAKPSTSEQASDAAAAAVLGTKGSFLPSGLIQWIFFAILILLVVILVRKLMGMEDKYHSEPMKHA